jgi:hypothetical protein
MVCSQVVSLVAEEKEMDVVKMDSKREVVKKI